MVDIALELLKEMIGHGYKAYIVGGFVRDYLLGIDSNDVDITTDATPKEIKEIFPDSCLPCEDYGSVIVSFKGVRFEITTFRREISYINNRTPYKIKYVDSLEEDLLRRDFLINTICMDENRKIIDLLNGREDLNNKIVRSVLDAEKKFSEDSLRILRAIRFATILDFSLDVDIGKSIINNKELLRNLSYYRKKEELDKIFTSTNYKKGIELLLKFGLEKELEIPNLSKVLDTNVSDLIGIWSILNVTDKYPFNKSELQLINKVNKSLSSEIDSLYLYHNGLYVSTIVAEINNLEVKDIIELYNNLVIKNRKDIDIDSDTIMNVISMGPGEYLKDIYTNLENEIISGRLENTRDKIVSYLKEEFL